VFAEGGAPVPWHSATMASPSLQCPVLYVTLVYYGQTVRWIKMKLGMKVGLGPGHIVLDGDKLPLPKKGRSPQFSDHCLLWPYDLMDQDATPLGMEVGLCPGHIVLDGDRAPAAKGAHQPPSPRPMSILATVADLNYC